MTARPISRTKDADADVAGPPDLRDHGGVRIFVYGTLLAGEANHGELRGARRCGAGRTAARYTLYDLGGYPGLVAGGTTAIVGEIYDVDAATLARLDLLEEHPTLYVRAPIALADGGDAETYLYPRARVGEAPPIASGDWKRRAPDDGRER